jgi:hypothetical protein
MSRSFHKSSLEAIKAQKFSMNRERWKVAKDATQFAMILFAL